MTGGKKKGLSIGAAMKQRMDSQDEGAAPEVEEIQQDPNQPVKETVEGTTPPPASHAETDALESFNTRLPRSLQRRLKIYAAQSGHKIQDVVTQALDGYLQQQES
ncbi:hypothetical protein [Deinococcus sp. SM5_A1]|uniref:hypothetical protein n=1 Tax=Deinococcus sp. SM5_A1 TaxID=3379094 RepID=UPI0038648571